MSKCPACGAATESDARDFKLCEECKKIKRKEYWKKYYNQNKERLKQYHLDYSKNNRDKRNAYNKKWKENNIEHCRKYWRDYYHKNKDVGSPLKGTTNESEPSSGIRDTARCDIKPSGERCTETRGIHTKDE